MSEERRKILEMVAQEKISVDEAERLLSALESSDSEESSEAAPGSPSSGFRYLRILVEPGPGSDTKERVNIRVPAKLIRAGLKWAAFIPKNARGQVDQALRDKGIDMDFDRITPLDIEELLVHLNDLTVDVEGKEKIRIFCE